MRKTNTHPILGACYIRTATIMNDPSFSLETQVEQIKAHAAAEGVEIVKIYSDEATSAHKTKYSPGIVQMLEDAWKGDFSIVYVHRLDRLARHLEWVTEIIKQLQQAKITLKAVEQNFDLATPESKLMLHLLFSLGEFYTDDNLSKKINEGKRRAQQPPMLPAA